MGSSSAGTACTAGTIMLLNLLVLLGIWLLLLSYHYRKPVLPIESELLPSDLSSGSDEECDVNKYCKSMLHMRKNLFSKANKNIKSAQARYKRDFDKRHQILNVYGSHWLTISNIGCPTGTINVYDSLPNCYLSSDTKRQIAAILFLTDQRKITVNFVDVQIQSNGSDCGVYALAFTTSLYCGDDPSKINYRSHKFRGAPFQLSRKSRDDIIPTAKSAEKSSNPEGIIFSNFL